MKQDEIFFGEQGLSSTSADFIANLAKEMLRKDESKIAGLSFVCEEISTLANPVKEEVSVGMEEADVKDIPATMERIMRLKSLIAWLREAIKAKDRLLKEVEKMNIYCDKWMETGWDTEDAEMEEMSKEEYLDTLSASDRKQMYKLQTKVAVLRKILHKDGAFEKARTRLSYIMKKPRDLEKMGINNIVHYYEPSVDSAIVDEIYIKLSTEYREAQAELNGYLHAMDATLQQNKVEVTEKNRANRELAKRKEKLQYAKLDEWKSLETKRISKLKIIIPNSMKDIYEEVQRVGK